MSKLWIFGDSFAELRDQDQEKFWQSLVAKNLNLGLVNVGVNGCSTSWLLHKWCDLQGDISKDDILILLLPFVERTCIFLDHPELSGLPAILQFDKNKELQIQWGINQKQVDAYKDFFLHLYNPFINVSLREAWFHWIDNFGFKHKPLILYTTDETIPNSFKNLHFAKGNLLDASISEFKNIDVWRQISSRGFYQDPRKCHFSWKNHQVLSNKIINYISNNDPVDLTNEWLTSIV